MKVVGTLVTVSVVLVIASLFFIYLGIYNVSATGPHSSLISWVLNTTMDNSVRRHAAGISAPPLTDPAMVRRGAAYYHASCALCHGAPGTALPPLAKGLHPPPPRLSDAVSGWTPAELFWIARNGVKMSGMPAFAATYSNEQLWSLVSFLERLPSLSAQDYNAMIQAAGSPSR